MRRDSVGVGRYRALTIAIGASCLVAMAFPKASVASGPVAGESSEGSEGVDAFNSIVPVICGRNVSTRSSFDSLMVESGFHKSVGDSWWEFVEPAGTTKVSALLPAAKYVSIVFVPARREPLPAAIIESMTAKALDVSFVPPDKMSFEFANIAKLKGCKSTFEVVITLKDGSWLESDETMTWGVKP